ncbi:hypothetical protein P8452_66228 [Trifolium repens]|jgi:hypothetical protein|nr:hypothetical protein QL285_086834 [Trifolium repens]KAK2389862.1 hypothetical protein QL285_063424 [Trifolium repens]KAK2397660.1 hypothetical protein QL285_059215 [Trifolium repens]WJX83572.1 hypothetical protein P8452_66228 [Trifolium repens]
MIPLILLIQSNQVTSKEKHTMERQVTKDASGSKGESKKEAEPWRCEENRLRYERNKQELRLTESEREELGSDLEEFLWTYDDDTSYEDYRAEVQKATEELLAVLRKKYKRLDAEASESKSKSK